MPDTAFATTVIGRLGFPLKYLTRKPVGRWRCPHQNKTRRQEEEAAFKPPQHPIVKMNSFPARVCPRERHRYPLKPAPGPCKAASTGFFFETNTQTYMPFTRGGVRVCCRFDQG